MKMEITIARMRIHTEVTLMKCVGIAVDLASMKPRMRTTTTDDVLETWGWLMSAPFFDLSGRAPIPHISISMIYNNVLFLLKGTEIPVFSMPLNFSPDIFGLNTRYFWFKYPIFLVFFFTKIT